MVSVQVAASQTINSHMWIVATLLMSTGLEDTSKGRLIFQRLFSWGKISSSLDLGTEYKHNFLNNKTQRYASVQFSRSVVSDSLRPHGQKHARPPCSSPTPVVYSNSCPWSRWCHPNILSSVAPFSSHPQSFPASGSFPMSQLFASGDQSIGVSAPASVLPMNSQDWFPLWLTDWISLHPKNSQESSPTPQFKSINSLALRFLYSPTLTSIHDYWKNHSFD